MLSLMDLVEVDGLVVFRDDEDARKFYLLPDQPVIATDASGAPEFLFIHYLKDVATTAEDAEQSGGYVQFRSSLTLSEERKAKVVAALRAQLTEEKAAGKTPFGKPIVSTEPLLASPLWMSGEVTLDALEVGDDGVSRYATKPAPADLAGDLGASFALQLDPDEAKIFWSLFKGEVASQLPIMVTYHLTYKARVSARMVIDAKHSEVRKRYWEAARPYRFLKLPFPRFVPVSFTGKLSPATLRGLRASLNLPLVAMVSKEQTKTLVTKGEVDDAIHVAIQTDEGTAGEGGAEVREMLYKVAADLLTERLIPSFFEDKTPQPGASNETSEAADQTLLQLREAEDSTDERSFHLELDHQSTVERTVSPSGPLRLLVEDPQKLAAAFRELRLADGFFSVMTVLAATVSVNFERDGIASIHVFFRYEQRDDAHPDKPMITRSSDALLKSPEDVARFRFDLARNAEGGHKRDYQFRSVVSYRESLPQTSTDWITASSQMLEITPRALGALRVELVLTAASTSVSAARVSLRHTSAAGVVYEARFDLSPKADRQTWFQYTGELSQGSVDLRPPAYEYRVEYEITSGAITTEWVTTSDQTLEIASPFVKTDRYVLRPQGSFEGTSAISGDVTYEDPARGYRVVTPFALDSLSASQEIVIPVLEGGPSEVSYVARVSRVDGSHATLPPRLVGPGTVWVGAEVSAFLEVQVIADLLDFDADVELVVVQLSKGSTQKTLVFSPSAHAPQTFKAALADPEDRSYRYVIKYVGRDRATSAEVTQEAATDAVLVLDRKASSPS